MRMARRSQLLLMNTVTLSIGRITDNQQMIILLWEHHLVARLHHWTLPIQEELKFQLICTICMCWTQWTCVLTNIIRFLWKSLEIVHLVMRFLILKSDMVSIVCVLSWALSNIFAARFPCFLACMSVIRYFVIQTAQLDLSRFVKPKWTKKICTFF